MSEQMQAPGSEIAPRDAAPTEPQGAVELLERRLRELAEAGLLGEAGPRLEARIRAAARQIVHERNHAHVAVSKERKSAFLVALASGLSVSAAAELAGLSRRSLYRHRDQDSVFAQEWEDAVEASLAPIEAQLQEIALTGARDSMATVRAAETLLRARTSRRREASSRMTLTHQGDDGVRIIEWQNNTPLPD